MQSRLSSHTGTCCLPQACIHSVQPSQSISLSTSLFHFDTSRFCSSSSRISSASKASIHTRPIVRQICRITVPTPRFKTDRQMRSEGCRATMDRWTEPLRIRLVIRWDGGSREIRGEYNKDCRPGVLDDVCAVPGSYLSQLERNSIRSACRSTTLRTITSHLTPVPFSGLVTTSRISSLKAPPPPL